MNNNNSRLTIFMLMAIFLISLSALLLEITLTRILSVKLSYHYVYLVISVSLLGLGLGGMFTHWLSRRFGIGMILLLTSSLALVVPLIIVTLVRLSSANLFLYSILILIPFTLTGIVIATTFRLYPSKPSSIYAADLCGAAMGALLAVPLLNIFGGPATGILVGSVLGISTLLLLALKPKAKWFPALSSVTAPILFILVLLTPYSIPLVLPPDQSKELSAILQADPGSAIVASRWSSFGRTDLVQRATEPDEMSIFTDATAGSGMYRFTGDINNPGIAVSRLKEGFSGAFPLELLSSEQKDNALIIGPGGGRDVLLTLLAGIRNVTAVEVNPDTVQLVKEFSDFNGGIYNNYPGVDVVVAEGRSFLQKQTRKYDLIMMSMPVTKTSRSPDGFALTESYLFTRESIADYLDHLTDNGRLVVVTHGELEVIKLVALSLGILEERGINRQEAMEQIYTIGSYHDSTFVLNKNPVSPSEVLQAHKEVHASASLMPDNSYFPYIKTATLANHVSLGVFDRCEMLDPVLTGLNTGHHTLQDMVRELSLYGYNIGSVSDERPFFYNFETGIPSSLSITFIISSLFLAFMLVIPYFGLKKKGKITSSIYSPVVPGKFTLFFLLLGAGFMLVELPLIQRFTLFLGEPVLALSVLLFSILVGAGIGGLTSSWFLRSRINLKIFLAIISVVILLGLYTFLPQLIFRQLIGISLAQRIILTSAMLLPLGFMLGFPFPLGMQLMHKYRLDARIPWMWGINGAASVLGSVLAIIIAMEFGFAAVIISGMVCYLLAWWVLPKKNWLGIISG